MRKSEFKVLKRRLKRNHLYRVVFKIENEKREVDFTLTSFKADVICFKEKTINYQDLLSIKITHQEDKAKRISDESIKSNLLSFKKIETPHHHEGSTYSITAARAF